MAYIKKQISNLDLGPIPKIAHYIYANIPKLKKDLNSKTSSKEYQLVPASKFEGMDKNY